MKNGTFVRDFLLSFTSVLGNRISCVSNVLHKRPTFFSRSNDMIGVPEEEGGQQFRCRSVLGLYMDVLFIHESDYF